MKFVSKYNVLIQENALFYLSGAPGTNSVQDANANRNTKTTKGNKSKKGKGANANKNSEAANGPNTRNPAKTNFIVGANADPIPSHNVGSRLMQKMGWTPGSGLGRQGTGITDPVEVVFRLGRKGIGAAPVPKRGQQKQTQQVNRPYTFPKPNNTRIVFDDDWWRCRFSGLAPQGWINSSGLRF